MQGIVKRSQLPRQSMRLAWSAGSRVMIAQPSSPLHTERGIMCWDSPSLGRVS